VTRRGPLAFAAALSMQLRGLAVTLAVYRLAPEPDAVFGILATVFAVAAVAMVPAKAGLEYALVQRVGAFHSTQPQRAAGAARAATALRFALGIGVSGLLYVLSGPLGGALGLADPSWIHWSAAVVAATSLTDFVAIGLTGLDRFGGFATVRIVFGVIAGFGAVLALLLGYSPPVAVLSAHVLGAALAGVLGLPAMWRGIVALGPTTPLAPAARDVLGFGGAMALVEISAHLNTFVDRIMLAPTLSTEALGAFSTAGNIATASMFVVFAFRTVARARLPLWLAQPSRPGVLQGMWTAGWALGAVVACSVWTVGPFAVRWVFSDSAERVAAWLPLYAPYVLGGALAGVLATSLASAGHASAVARLAVVGALVNIGLNAWWIPAWGAEGALAGSTLAWLFPWGLGWIAARRAWGEPRLFVNIAFRWIAWVLVSGGSFQLMPERNWGRLLLWAGIVSVVGGIMAVRSGDVARIREAISPQ